MTVKTTSPVIVVGAGPVGLFVALLLARAGIKVTVLEKSSHFDQSPRAVVYFPAAIDEFEKAGILPDLMEAGDKNQSGCDWRDASSKILASATPPPHDPQFGLFLGQPEFCEIVYKNLLQTGNAQVLMNHAYFRHEQQVDGSIHVWVGSTSAESGTFLGACQYLIGADGGRSAVRKALGVKLEGFTWENTQMVACNFSYPLDHMGWKKANFIIDPEKWGVVVKRGKGDLWRLAAGVRSTNDTAILTDDMVEEVKDRLRLLLPGDTSKIEWESMAPYKIHQRCATTFRKGNVLLAGDAAHLNNPLGGLGLNTGLLDAAHLGENLKEILLSGANPNLLDRYAEIRRDIWRYRTDPFTTANMIRARSQKPEDVAKRDQFFKAINEGKDLATIISVAKVDYALSSTSKTTFPAYEEIEWFITVTKRDDWPEDKFTHEYKVVHAGMTREGKKHGAPILGYTQHQNLKEDAAVGKSTEWDYVTRLRWPSMFILHASMQDAGYKANAGSHIFCRLDTQQGTLTRRIATFSKNASKTEEDLVRVLLFHRRIGEEDFVTADWTEKRSDDFITHVKTDDLAQGYTLWQDITPPNTNTLFKGNPLFEPSQWHNFKAVESFDFNDVASAKAYLHRNRVRITDDGALSIQTVFSKPDIII
ncbi:hypothetical protein COCC4DRAFT_203938 [Bipolaris maydis ATCC 48331]|uniref:FAD-binding domain-containing protein n=2 Tax=Cochliobolus heterostrophus TaxID=5016 RepID=M2UGK1_COCH5|nr:uncharacterized protein COCC4DRAFT_203938 [Bipolaris maydis ATCC 48331]EMD97564.1 hypothetical protein COCHEDRAFT_1164647 [Bipolaris maydis C5]KAJ5030991.1 FAD binding domain-containing protein [Bipolaris maydis]ENI01298.1 hypothetical protein COCC4DRAFT_203938 [Bipolaris maydis ATCC 48331]KAJ5046968.1 FAD binding domain-containing protein [Bipolaris maydis]KAJ5052675.1 FAD binding domain-containing protein [Bipolaris maydis]